MSATKPASRAELKEWCLRKLGKPVIQINVADSQLEDRIDEALQKFFEYHIDGAIQTYYSHEITEQDITNKYITIPSSIPYVLGLFVIGGDTKNQFSAAWQIQMNAVQTLSDYNFSGISNFVTQKSNIEMVRQFLNPLKQIDFSRHENRVYIATDFDEQMVVGNYLVFEVYKIVDETQFSSVYNDAWLKKYVTALFKDQWGANLSKFAGVQLLNGMTLDGQRIHQEAAQELKDLEETMIRDYSGPVRFVTG